jgi:hypothetical protein
MLSATLNLHDDYPELSEFKGALTQSAVFHVCLLVLAVFGLPIFSNELPPIENAINIEFVTPAEMSESDKKPAKKDDVVQKTTKRTENEVIKPPKTPKPAAPKNTSAAPAPPKAPQPPELVDEVAMPREIEMPKPREKPVIPESKPKPRKRIITAPENEKPNPDDRFNTLLKNLTPEEQAAQNNQAENIAEKPRIAVPLGQRMTMGEQDALRRQLSMCWNVVAGARYAENLVVKLKLTVSPGRIVQSARVVDFMRYNTDNYFRAAADSALRAVRHQRCTPLDLPPDKYEQWKDMTVTFDPREML